MCVPRTDPRVKEIRLPAEEPAPRPGLPQFSIAGVALPASGELSAPAAGQKYCSQ